MGGLFGGKGTNGCFDDNFIFVIIIIIILLCCFCGGRDHHDC